MRNAIRQQAVVRFFGDRWAGESDDFGAPDVRNRVARDLDHVQLLRRRKSEEREEVGEFVNCRGRVCGGYALMRGLEVEVQVKSVFVAFVLLENSGDDRAGEAWLVGDER